MEKLLKKLVWKPRFLVLIAAVLLSLAQLGVFTGKINLQWGFDIQGGVRAVLKPTNQSVDLEDVVLVLQNRLNIYGLKDIRVRPASDLQNKYILIEAAGLTKRDIEKLLTGQGKFEGKIGNTTVFTSGDIKILKHQIRLYRDPSTGYYRFEIPVVLSPEAAKRFAEATKDLFSEPGTGYLEEPLRLYLDNELVDELKIAEDLRGKETAYASITGGAANYTAARRNLNRLKAILLSGALPTALRIESIQKVDPLLGKEFLKGMIFAGIVAFLLVAVVVSLRYGFRAEVIATMLFIALAEVIITLGIASVIRWQLDLAAIAGLIVILGTGIDQEVIILDELLSGEKSKKISLKEATKIIFAAIGTTVAAMLPLAYIGVGAIRGFAIITVIGLIVAYTITRPGFIAIIEEVLGGEA